MENVANTVKFHAATFPEQPQPEAEETEAVESSSVFMPSLFDLTVHLSMELLMQQSINTRNPRSTEAVLAGCLFWM